MPDGLLQEIDVRDVIQVDDGAQLVGQRVIGRRRFVGREHQIVAVGAAGVGQHELHAGGAVATAAVLAQNVDEKRVGSRLDGEVLAEAGIP